MYKFIFLPFFLLITNNLFSQTVYPYEQIKLDKPAECKKAEPFALMAANYLLTSIYKKADSDRERSFQFLIRWTAADQDYNFSLQGVILEMAQDRELMQLFLAAMTKFCLENKTVGSNSRLIENASVKMVLKYCNDPANNFTLKKKARKKMESY